MRAVLCFSDFNYNTVTVLKNQNKTIYKSISEDNTIT